MTFLALSPVATSGTSHRNSDGAWKVYFGPDGGGGYTPVRSGSFEGLNYLGIEIPVLGPDVMVDAENRGTTPSAVYGMMRIVRDLE